MNYFQGSPGLVTTNQTYTNQDLTPSSAILLQTGTPINNATYTLAYDSHTNPFYGSYFIGRYFGGIGEWFQRKIP